MRTLSLLIPFFTIIVAFQACNREQKVTSIPTEDTAVLAAKVDNTEVEYAGFDTLSFALPPITVTEFDPDIEVFGDENRATYSLGDNILFELDKATINERGKKNLMAVMGNIESRYPNARIRVMGHTDTTGSKGYNRQLAEERAENVKNMMVENGVSPERISVQSYGERTPIMGVSLRQNRRVVIAVVKDAN